MSTDDDTTEIEDIGCIEAINGLYAYLDGEIDDQDAIEKIEHHLGHCRHCYSRTELERALSERLRKSAKEKAPEKLQHRLRDLIDRF